MVNVDELNERYPEEKLMYPTGFEDCIIGVCEDKMILVIDADKVINKLVEEDGMTHEDALEHYSYNIEGSKGEGFPIYVRTKL